MGPKVGDDSSCTCEKCDCNPMSIDDLGLRLPSFLHARFRPQATDNRCVSYPSFSPAR
jgi:hypothetical protein